MKETIEISKSEAAGIIAILCDLVESASSTSDKKYLDRLRGDNGGMGDITVAFIYIKLLLEKAILS